MSITVLWHAAPLLATHPDRKLTQYVHTAWRIQDGFFAGSPIAVVQTQDGYVWFGTRSGLLRFDGVRFVRWSPGRGASLPTNEITRLLVASDGSLWIGTRGGLSRWKDQRLTNYASTSGGVLSILEDREGHIWFQKLIADEGKGPLCQITGDEVRCHGKDDGIPFARGGDALAEDEQGNLWVGGETTLLRWKSGSGDAYAPKGLALNTGMEGVTGLAFAPDGTLFVGMGVRGPGLGLQKLVGSRWEPIKTNNFDVSALIVSTLYPDREGALWIGTRDQGIFRLYGNEVEHFDSTKGLSSDNVWAFTEDREGNLWAATSQGVDRFSDTKVVSFSKDEGLCSNEIDSILAPRDGSLWIGGTGAVSILRDGKVSCLRTEHGLPGSQVTSMLEDRAGRIWVGIDDTLSVYETGSFRQIKRRDGTRIGLVTGIAEDIQSNIWATVLGPPRSLIRIKDLTMQELRSEPQLPGARRVVADPTGGLWLGLMNGDLARYSGGKLTTYSSVHDQAAQVNQILVNPDGSIFAAASYGLQGVRNGKLRSLTSKNGLPCNDVNAITLDNQNNLWLYMECALVKIASANLQRWWDNPEIDVPLTTFDAFDGVRTGRAPFVAAAKSRDGRLWFVNGELAQMIDPTDAKNGLAPPVHIEQIVADHKTYALSGVIQLPPRTRDLEIDYTGLSFVAPQKVSFRYRLDERDKSWLEAGNRRQAFYSNLQPGTYHFQVIASNNNGVWNEEEATLSFRIAPAWFQTNWFRFLCIVAATAMILAAYRIRMRYLTRTMTARFDERLAERTRIARELHDTFLQTIQGTKLVADDALENVQDSSRTRNALEQLSAWLARATQESRAALYSLRASSAETNDLAAALGRALEDCGREKPSMDTALFVTGKPRGVHPVVRDEVYRIGYEAIRNACVHSAGTRIDVALNYAKDLNLSIRDNGIGIDPEIVVTGRTGHFGLQGMRERAARIGANLTISNAGGAGAEVKLIVPGRTVFS